MPKRAVIGGFCICREAAAGQLLGFQVIGDTLATDPFSRAWVIGAIAYIQVFLLITFHDFLLLILPDRSFLRNP